jgi:hypothetical protein
LTLRQLVLMARGKHEAQWWHTAAILATLANVNRGKGAALVAPRQCHPHYAGRTNGLPVTRENVGTVATMFVSPEKQRQAEAKAAAQQQSIEELTRQMRKRMTQCSASITN